jgi:hypothetical protein
MMSAGWITGITNGKKGDNTDILKLHQLIVV